MLQLGRASLTSVVAIPRSSIPLHPTAVYPLHVLEQKDGTSFEEFDKRFRAGKIPDQHGYEVEQDYLEWEGLLCRQRRLKEVEEWLR